MWRISDKLPEQEPSPCLSLYSPLHLVGFSPFHFANSMRFIIQDKSTTWKKTKFIRNRHAIAFFIHCCLNIFAKEKSPVKAFQRLLRGITKIRRLSSMREGSFRGITHVILIKPLTFLGECLTEQLRSLI